jgi:predicted transcriptional regulator of viral defense system
MTPLSERLRGRLQPLGYVSYRSALVHHGVVIDSLAVVQVASVELGGRDDTTVPGPVRFILIARDLYFGYALEPFEGDVVPVASAEKALLDWIDWTEQTGVDPRLEEIEWQELDLGRLDQLAAATGIDYRLALRRVQGRGQAAHDQDRLRRERLPTG